MANGVDGDAMTSQTRGARAEEQEATARREAEALAGDAMA